jgi:hypothetical protein
VEGTAAGEEEAVACLEADGVGHAVKGEPALAGDEGVAFDAFMLGEADGPLPAHVKAAAHEAAGFEEGEDVGERIGCSVGRLRR